MCTFGVSDRTWREYRWSNIDLNSSMVFLQSSGMSLLEMERILEVVTSKK